MGKYVDQSGLSRFLSKLLSIFVKKTDLMGGASSAADGHPGIVPTPGSGNQAKFLRGDATWVVPTNTWNALKAATSAANGTAGYVAAPTSANFANRALMYLRSDATWQYLPLQNNATTTATYYALDARMGKTLNDRINIVGTRTVTTWASYTATTSWVRQTTNSATLAAGTWLISIYARSAVTTNTFQVGVGTTSGATVGGVNYVTVPKKEYNLDSEATSVSIIVLSESTTLYPWVRCGNGTGTTVYMQFYAVRLK